LLLQQFENCYHLIGKNITYAKMLADLILCGTLLVNAAAVLNFKLNKKQDIAFAAADPTTGDKVRDFLASLQYFRVFIGMWNVFIMFLMIVFFAA